MSDDRREGLSRRGLLDVFGRGLKRLRDDLEEGPADAADVPAPSSSPDTAYRLIRRPGEQCVAARPVMPGVWEVALEDRPLPIGTSVIVGGGDLPENVVLVRVHPTHLAACTAECPVDGSDLEWSETDDRLVCPGCASQWRLDGEPTYGPGQTRLGTLIVDAYIDDVGGLEVRISAP